MNNNPPPAVEYYCRNCGHRSEKPNSHKCGFGGAVASFAVLFWVLVFLGGLYFSGKI